MPDLFGIGAYGIHPFLSEDLMKQAKYGEVKNKAGKIAYLLALGEKAAKPKIEDGIQEARGALKHIQKFFEEKEDF